MAKRPVEEVAARLLTHGVVEDATHRLLALLGNKGGVCLALIHQDEGFARRVAAQMIDLTNEEIQRRETVQLKALIPKKRGQKMKK